MNIGLMFVNEPIKTDREAKQKETDKSNRKKLGSNNFFINFLYILLEL